MIKKLGVCSKKEVLDFLDHLSGILSLAVLETGLFGEALDEREKKTSFLWTPTETFIAYIFEHFLDFSSFFF